MREGRRLPRTGNVPWVAIKCGGGKIQKKPWRFRPGMKVLQEIRKFPKSTKLLIPKIAILSNCKRDLTKRAVMAVYSRECGACHETAEAYLVHMTEDTNMCTIHTKHVMNLWKDIQLACYIRGKHWVSVTPCHIAFKHIKMLYICIFWVLSCNV